MAPFFHESLFRWVTKIFQIFRPAPAVAETAERKSVYLRQRLMRVLKRPSCTVAEPATATTEEETVAPLSTTATSPAANRRPKRSEIPKQFHGTREITQTSTTRRLRQIKA